jgi:hypothetical protein
MDSNSNMVKKNICTALRPVEIDLSPEAHDAEAGNG